MILIPMEPCAAPSVTAVMDRRKYSFYNLLCNPPPDPPAILHHEPSPSFVIHRVGTVEGHHPLTSTSLASWLHRWNRHTVHLPTHYPSVSAFSAHMDEPTYTTLLHSLNAAGDWDMRYIRLFAINAWLSIAMLVIIPMAVLAIALSHPLQYDLLGRPQGDDSPFAVVVVLVFLLLLPLLLNFAISRYCITLTAHRMAYSLEEVNATHPSLRVWLLQSDLKGTGSSARLWAPGTLMVRWLLFTVRVMDGQPHGGGEQGKEEEKGPQLQRHEDVDAGDRGYHSQYHAAVATG